MRDIGCSSGKCSKLLAALDTKGLIERHKRGLGRPDIIYVKNLTVQNEAVCDLHAGNDEPDEMPETVGQEETVQNIQSASDLHTEMPIIDFKRDENRIPEKQKSHLQRNRNRIPRETKIASPEKQKSHPNYNYNNINYTDNSYTDVCNLINLINHLISLQLKNNAFPDIKDSLPTDNTKAIKNKSWEFNSYVDGENGGNRSEQADIQKEEAYMQLIRENISYDMRMSCEMFEGKEKFKEIYTLMCDVVNAKCKSVWISGKEYPHELVKARFLSLNGEHILYVINSVNRIRGKIHNIRSYLITSLYNAPSTMSHYYENEVAAAFG